MKKLTTTIIGLSLFVGSALSAQDNFASFYPVENNDTPSYLLSDNNNIKGHQTLATSSINANSLHAFYPAEDNDSVNYGFQSEIDTSLIALSLDSKSISVTNDTSFDAFYPIEDDDSAKY